MDAAYAPDIAERLIRTGRPGEAMDWLKRTRRPLDDDGAAHIDLMVEVGDHATLMTARTVSFLGSRQ
jgi:hypothetical protein